MCANPEQYHQEIHNNFVNSIKATLQFAKIVDTSPNGCEGMRELLMHGVIPIIEKFMEFDKVRLSAITQIEQRQRHDAETKKLLKEFLREMGID